MKRQRIQRGRLRRQDHPTEHIAWANMKQRCQNPKHPMFYCYGDRGIQVCERWSNSFADFLSDVGKRPSPELSLDRFPNKDGNYEPGNVRWATTKEQHENRNPKGAFKRSRKKQPISPRNKIASSFIDWAHYDLLTALEIAEHGERQMLVMRLSGSRYEEIASAFNLTRESVRRILVNKLPRAAKILRLSYI